MLKNCSSDWLARQMMVLDIFEYCGAVLDRAGIPYMAGKGAHLIRTGLSGSLQDRRIDDIDIFVRPDSLAAATAVLFADPAVTPLVSHEVNHRPSESQCLVELPEGRILVELHCELNFQERFLLPFDDIFARAVKHDGSCEFKMQPEDALLVAICHAMTHIPFEWRDTNCAEWRLLALVPGFLWEEFHARARATGCYGFIRLMCTYMYDCVDMREPAGFPPLGIYGWVQWRMLRLFTPEGLPGWYRRIFLELAFVRDPLGLLRIGMDARSG